ncbi:hypothetical protein FB562_2668 [Homoserinimonas aerilata]|uniref:Uncharacterized protein n=1 Tax=Homoserinimonas aerilata TaxID=1162970 RepID=A0A542XXB9_9MICO|nr:hypothetical protein [Homoserinimonas aerilata]TQL40459.1 hypothetical protein FB562_2668 [Homoserinimonas aerilata]
MTIRHIVTAMLRRWYAPLALLLCAVLATALMLHDGGTYSTRTVISFMRPSTTTLSPSNGTNDSNIIAFAAAVTAQVNNGRAAARYSMDDAPFYGAGIREGVLVDLADSGNQWAATIDKAEIEVQVVGRTLDWVESRQQQLIDKIVSTAESQQAQLSVTDDGRITASVVPLTTQIEHVTPSRSALVTAFAAMLAVALLIGAWASVGIDRMLTARHDRASDSAKGQTP